MGASQRTKGHSFERRVAQWLREKLVLGDFWRNVSETQQGNSGDVRDRSSRWPLVIQTKHGASPSPWNAMKEAEEASSTSELPVAIVRRNGGETLVILRPEDLAVLLLALDYLAAANKVSPAQAIAIIRDDWKGASRNYLTL